jgi:prefoldin subunit 5
MTSKMKDEATLNQQVEELRERIRILRKSGTHVVCGLGDGSPCTVTYVENDRKSNIDVLEANKNSNKDDIKRLRDDNKDLRQKLAQLQKV